MGIALLVTLALNHPEIRGPLFVPAILLSAWYGGTGPALLAVGLSVLVIDFFLGVPKYTLHLFTFDDALYLLVFSVSALFTAWLARVQRRISDALRDAHGELTTKVEDLERTNLRLQAEITERQRAEEALQRSQAELARVTRLTMLGEITASIAHEVNQPLAAIVMNGNACRRWLSGDPPNVAEAREASLRVVNDGTRAGQVIARVRALVQRGTPVRSALDVNAVIQETLAFTRNELERHNVRLQTELRDDLPRVMGDRVQLQQVLVNLILNGVDAMSEVVDRPRVLTITSRREGSNTVLVQVKDCGKGLKPEDAERIFEPFFSTKDAGLGMGLSISRSIVEQHGGKIVATHNDGPGLTMRFSLPAASGVG